MNTAPEPLEIGVVLFSGFELLDVYGPLEMFGALGDKVSISMLAEQTGMITSSSGPKGVADIPLNQANRYDILLIPGGKGTRREVNNSHFIQLLRHCINNASYVASVCTGSALLAKTGALDGKNATSNKLAFDWVTSQGPKVKWIREARWVEDGRFFSSSGVSAGMDMALGLIEHLYGRELALQTARWAEYLWNEDKTSDPFANLI